jgi:peptidoglycan/xylan/chitin deacetylase (PgdA/CDA1 family)
MSARRWRFLACAAVVVLTVIAATLGCAERGERRGDGGASTSVTPPATGSSTTVATASTTTIPFASTTAPVSTARPTAKPPTTVAPGALVPGKEYAKVPGKARVVAFTFDAAYDPEPLADILEALSAAHAPATFFLTGEFVADYPDSVAKIVRAGFPIGNHSYSHPDFTTLSEAKMRSQLERTAALIEDAGGGDPRPLFRFPYGARDKRTLAAVGDAGYASVYWTIDTLDWKPKRTSAQIAAAVLDHLQPGAIILMHVGSHQTASVLPEIIRKVRAEGYELVALR